MLEGLSATLRQEPEEQPELNTEPQDVEISDGDDSGSSFDDAGNLLSITLPDGSIEINLNGPLKTAQDNLPPPGWFDNLCDRIDAMELSRIAEDLLRGIEQDLTSRQSWVDDRANGMKLLGTKLNVPGVGGSVDGAPVEGMSRIQHPLLLEACLRFQANARSELLPTDGPCKIRDDGNNATTDDDELADDYEKDMNHYLTVVASEFYPDTDRMLMLLGMGGLGIKKVYFCPIRNRPVSESIDADDFIINNSATDIQTAKRVTHRVDLAPNTVKRLQILKVYRDVELGTPMPTSLDAAQQEKASQQGVDPSTLNAEDRDREIYECYCDLDVKGYEHKIKGEESGLEIPYRVTIDKTSRQILAIVRDYDEDTKDLPERRETFVPYIFVPGFGFYPIGLLHILGNTTNAVTAAWRELLDMGMFANFPGFLMSDAGGRQNTNIFRIPPGGGQLVKTGGMDIRQAIMPMPYSMQGAPALMSLVQDIVQTGQRVGGTAELSVGEGRADAPVGTTLALIEQAQKVMNSVHKRLHASQAKELQLIAKCFRQHPDSFWQRNRKPARTWDEQTFLRALDDVDLVPQADPNTASHTERIMKAVAVKQLQTSNPALYDPKEVDSYCLRTIGITNPDKLFAQSQGPNPQVMQEAAETQAKTKTADARMLEAQAKAKETDAKIQQGLSGGKTPEELAIDKQRLSLDQQDQQFTQQRAQVEDENRDKDREASLATAEMNLTGKMMQQENKHQHERAQQQAAQSQPPNRVW